MSAITVFPHSPLLNLCTTNPRCFYRPGPMKQLSSFTVYGRLSPNKNRNPKAFHFFRNRLRCFKKEDKENYEASKSKDISDTQDRFSNKVQINGKEGHNKLEISFLAMIVIALGIAVTATIASIARQPILGPSFGLHILSEGSSSSTVAPASHGFTFKAFGYRVILPEYAPGWIYFWLHMAATCGLFINEEALNTWVCLFHWLAYQ